MHNLHNTLHSSLNWETESLLAFSFFFFHHVMHHKSFTYLSSHPDWKRELISVTRWCFCRVGRCYRLFLRTPTVLYEHTRVEYKTWSTGGFYLSPVWEQCTSGEINLHSERKRGTRGKVCPFMWSGFRNIVLIYAHKPRRERGRRDWFQLLCNPKKHSLQPWWGEKLLRI